MELCTGLPEFCESINAFVVLCVDAKITGALGAMLMAAGGGVKKFDGDANKSSSSSRFNVGNSSVGATEKKSTVMNHSKVIKSEK